MYSVAVSLLHAAGQQEDSAKDHRETQLFMHPIGASRCEHAVERDITRKTHVENLHVSSLFVSVR
jgi:hypothetical protein